MAGRSTPVLLAMLFVAAMASGGYETCAAGAGKCDNGGGLPTQDMMDVATSLLQHKVSDEALVMVDEEVKKDTSEVPVSHADMKARTKTAAAPKMLDQALLQKGPDGCQNMVDEDAKDTWHGWTKVKENNFEQTWWEKDYFHECPEGALDAGSWSLCGLCGNNAAECTAFFDYKTSEIDGPKVNNDDWTNAYQKNGEKLNSPSKSYCWNFDSDMCAVAPKPSSTTNVCRCDIGWAESTTFYDGKGFPSNADADGYTRAEWSGDASWPTGEWENSKSKMFCRTGDYR